MTIQKNSSDKALSYLQKACSRAIEEALAGMLGPSSLQVEAVSASAAAELIWYRQDFQPADAGFLSWGIERTAAIALGNQLLVATGLEGESEETAVETWKEVLSQALSAIAAGLSEFCGSTITTKPLIESTVSPSVASQFSVQISISPEPPVLCAIALAPSLLEKMSRTAEPVSLPVPETGLVPQMPPTKNLPLLLGVEMSVSISFGRTQLPLHDVLRLNTGSVVELNRVVGEPVEVIVNNTVIARGQVVVVEGNYGIRVQEVLSKQERLRSLT